MMDMETQRLLTGTSMVRPSAPRQPTPTTTATPQRLIVMLMATQQVQQEVIRTIMVTLLRPILILMAEA